MSSSPLSRRQLLAHAWRAGVGVGALALAGCGGPDTFNARSEQDDGDDQAAPAGSPLRTEPAARTGSSEPSSQENAAAGGQDAPAQARQDEQALPITAPPIPDDAVDPLVWRERYHWRELARLPGQSAGPVRSSALQVHAAAPRIWSPFALGPATLDAGTMLPLLYSQLLVMAAGDQRDAHHGEIEGDLASAWETPDPNTLLFTLRPDVQWPDAEPLNGRMLTASDVLINHDAHRSPVMPQASAYEAVERIEADDRERTVAFHLSEPASYLPAKMTNPLHVIAPPHYIDDPGLGAVEPGPSNPAPNIHGTGPFVLEYTSVVSWGAVRNPDYFKHDQATGTRLPHLDRIRGGILLSRNPTAIPGTPREEIWRDWTDQRFDAIQLLSPAELSQSQAMFPDLAAQVAAPTPGRGSELIFGTISAGPFADPRVRHALSAAIDRAALAQRAHHGLAAPDCGHDWTHVTDDSTPSGFREWPWTPEEIGEPYVFDPDHARSLLAAAGYGSDNPLPIKLDAGGTEVFTISVDPRITAAVADQWQTNLGPAANVQLLPRSVTTSSQGGAIYREVRPHQNANITSWSRLPQYAPDPDALTYGKLHSSANRLLQDALIDELCKQQRQELDPIKRSEILEQIRQRDLEISWRLPLVNPYGLLARQAGVFNVTATHIAHSFDLNPKQFERAWHLPPN